MGALRTITWRSCLALMLVIALGSEHLILADGMPAGKTRVFSEYEQYRRELNSSGPLKFYEATEEMLRAAQFERAIMRYMFLQGQIQGHDMYRPLLAQVDHRLNFLRAQMQLPESDVAPVQPPKRKKYRRRVAKKTPPACPPVPAKPEGAPKDQKEPPKPAEGTPAAAPAGLAPTPPAATTAEPAAPTPKTQEPQASATPAETPPAPEVKGDAKDKTEEAPKPPPPPASTWEKLKQRIRGLFKKSD